MRCVFCIYICVFISGFSLADSELDGDNYSNEFKNSFISIKKTGPNFNFNDYIFEYPCGGGAICSSIYSGVNKVFVDFPDNFIGASEGNPFHLKFELNSNKVCIWGESAYDNTVYNNNCYQLNGIDFERVDTE